MATNPKPSADDLAQWMANEVASKGELYQSDAYDHIERQNSDLALESDRGHLSIAPAVLKVFRKLTANTVVWESQGKYWRTRVAQDAEGRKQS